MTHATPHGTEPLVLHTADARGVHRLTLNQPKSFNVLSEAMLTELLLKNGLGALGVHAISKPQTLASGITIHRVLMSDDRLLWLCFDTYQQGFKDEVIKANPAQVIMLNSCFNNVDDKADEHISNLQLELTHHSIGLLII